MDECRRPTRTRQHICCPDDEPNDSPQLITCQNNESYQRRRPRGDKSASSQRTTSRLKPRPRAIPRRRQQQQQQVVSCFSNVNHTRQGNMVSNINTNNNYRVISINSFVIVNFAATLFLLQTSTTATTTATSSQQMSSMATAASTSRQHLQHPHSLDKYKNNNDVDQDQVRASDARTASLSGPLTLNDTAAAAGDTSKTAMEEHLITNNSKQRQQQQQQQQQVSAVINANSEESSALSYLQRYGYMSAPAKGWETTNNNLISEESFTKAIYDFQRFAGLSPTGQIDNETLLLMQLPRCGNADKSPQMDSSSSRSSHMSGGNQLINQQRVSRAADRSHSHSHLRHHLRRNNSSTLLRRRRRYALQGSKWRRQELTYRISQYPTRFISRRHEVDAQIHKAFSIWSQVAPIDFVPKREGRVHIDIRFASGDHGDGDAFDGPGNTLAHAYFPQYGGDAHFDDQEYWTIDSYTGTNIFQVAAHELGHSLGLGHSNVRGALMAPFYQKYKPNFKLHIDDILAIQALYGEKPVSGTSPNDVATDDDLHRPLFPSVSSPAATTTTTTTTTTSSTTTTTAAPPSDGSRSRYPIYTGFGRGTHRPSFFGDSPTTSTTVYREPNDNDGNSIVPNQDPGVNYIGRDNEPGDGFPADLCSDPSIDAVTRTEDGNTFVFKGDYYWQLVNDGIAKGYPRQISTDWDGLPGNLDAALTWVDGKTFFFKGNKYWRFRNRRRDVGYPKLIKVGFAGIPDNIDAAFVWSGNGRTYIFKGTEYWRFDSKSDPPVSSEYPRSIKVWSGVPANVDAAFKWENNITYFFKDRQYYRFNDREFKVEERGRPAFPRNTANWWFGCASSNLAAQRTEPNNSVREGGHVTQSQSSRQDGSAQQNDGEWSFLAGLETNTHELGTHINDRKPTNAPSPAKPRFDERDEDINAEPYDDNNKPEQWIPQPDQQPSLIPRADNEDHMNPPIMTSRRSQSGVRLSPGNNPFASNVPTTQSSALSLHHLLSPSMIKVGDTNLKVSWTLLQYACISLISSYLLTIRQAPQTQRSFRV